MDGWHTIYLHTCMGNKHNMVYAILDAEWNSYRLAQSEAWHRNDVKTTSNRYRFGPFDVENNYFSLGWGWTKMKQVAYQVSSAWACNIAVRMVGRIRFVIETANLITIPHWDRHNLEAFALCGIAYLQASCARDVRKILNIPTTSIWSILSVVQRYWLVVLLISMSLFCERTDTKYCDTSNWL